MQLDLTSFETRWEKLDSPIARDLKLNFKRLVGDSTLSPKESALVSIAVGKALGYAPLIEWSRAELQKAELEPQQILEAEESAALMGMLNSYYKFRSFVARAEPDLVKEQYSQAGLRMTALARPQLGKETFELLALVVSIVNGCETCVTSHERVLREGGFAPAKIHDAVRLTAVIKGLYQLEN